MSSGVRSQHLTFEIDMSNVDRLTENNLIIQQKDRK